MTRLTAEQMAAAIIYRSLADIAGLCLAERLTPAVQNGVRDMLTRWDDRERLLLRQTVADLLAPSRAAARAILNGEVQ